MKTKLNFLLPLFLGIVMVLAFSIALEACSSESNSPTEQSSSSGIYAGTSSEVEDPDGNVRIFDFGINQQTSSFRTGKIELTGYVQSTAANKINSVEFIGDFKLKRNDEEVNKTQTWQGDARENKINFNNYTLDASSLNCGTEYGVTVKVCAEGVEVCPTKNASFTTFGCPSSDSQSSSSSAEVWVFGELQNVVINTNGSGTMGSTIISLTESSIGGGDNTEIIIKVNSATIGKTGTYASNTSGLRFTSGTRYDESDITKLGMLQDLYNAATKNEETLIANLELFMAKVGNDYYLLWPDTYKLAWPITIKYMKASEHP